MVPPLRMHEIQHGLVRSTVMTMSTNMAMAGKRSARIAKRASYVLAKSSTFTHFWTWALE